MREVPITYQTPWDKDSRQNGSRHVGRWGTTQIQLVEATGTGEMRNPWQEIGPQVVENEVVSVCSGEGTLELRNWRSSS
jgi:hypothetical protein